MEHRATEIPEGLTPEHTLVVSVSGGKDSTAMALWLKFESGLPNPMRFVFADTGHEHPDTLEHLRHLEEKLEAPVEAVRGRWTFIELCEYKQMFPSSRVRFCTQFLKVKPMAQLVERLLEGGVEPVMCTGVRAQESASRARLDEWVETDEGYDCSVWRPLLRWTHEDVFNIHDRHTMPVNPLYLKGAKRVGCFPCIMSTKDDLVACFQIDPDLLDRLRDYERRVGDVSGRSGRSFFPKDKTPEAFHDTVVSSKQGETHTTASIDAVYRWAMDPDQPRLDFGDPPTCFSQYGLCE